MKIGTQLQSEIEQTRDDFHQLLQRIPAEAFGLPSNNPAWTVGQVLYHMSIAPRFMVTDVNMILKHSTLFQWLPKLFPKRLFDWLNARLTRYGARNLNRQFLANEYDKAHAAILQMLNTLTEDDLQTSVHYPDWDPLLADDITLAYLFGYIKRHFDSHQAQIEQVLERSTRMTISNQRKRVTGIGRFFFRAPIFLYRVGLGGLLGKRFLLLNHIGRKSGLPRQAMLEVVNYERAADTYYIAAGFGKKSHWYRNILAQPQVNIQVGWRKMAVTAVPLDPEASGEAMVDYAQRYPTAAKNLSRLIGFNVSTEDEYRAVGRDAVPFIALQPR
jgi:deazaflavin-dependent oxidoreductase (nitroreductase family)